MVRHSSCPASATIQRPQAKSDRTCPTQSGITIGVDWSEGWMATVRMKVGFQVSEERSGRLDEPVEVVPPAMAGQLRFQGAPQALWTAKHDEPTAVVPAPGQGHGRYRCTALLCPLPTPLHGDNAATRKLSY
jgi:hypothetical protein